MKKIEVVKLIGGVVVSLSVGLVIGNAIKMNTPESLKLIQKIGVGIGGLILHGLVCERAQEYVDHQIDAIAKDVGDIVEQVKESSEVPENG